MTLRFSKITLALAVFGASLIINKAYAASDVVVAVQSSFTTTDPYDANDTLSQAVSKSFYQGLYGFDKNFKIEPVLAESYSVSKDGLTYTVKLKSGIVFHDGTPFNAEAVKINFDRATNPDNKLKRYNLYKNIVKTEALDANSVRFTLAEPFSPFINTLAHPSAAMISPAALAKYGSKGIAQNPVGTGPFTLVEWKSTDYLKVAKFANYWKKGYPKVDSITWRPIADNNTRAAVMQTNEAHFAYPVPPEMVLSLSKNAKLEVVESPSIQHRYISMNTQQKPFDNLKVRQAINYAINKEALIKVAFSGYATPAEGPLPKGIEYATQFGAWPYDLAKAKQLLKEAGYPDGFESTLWAGFNNTTSQKVIQFTQQQLAQVGIKLKIEALEAGQRVERVESAQDPAKAAVRMYYIGWAASTGQADWAMRPLFASDSMPPKSFNTAYYKNDAVDADIAKALVATDSKERASLYADAQKRIWDDAPWVFLATERLLSVRSRNLTGFYVIPDTGFSFDEIELK